MFSNLPMRLSALFLMSGLASPMISIAEESGDSPAWRQFEFDDKTISVSADTDAEGKRSYEVLAEQTGLAVARLSVNRDGVLSDAWKTDLDQDGSPEVVVAVGQLNGTNNGTVDIHEWDGHKFVSTRGQDRIPSAQAFYDGHDQFSFTDGQLVREFPRFRDEGGARVPAGETASYVYQMSSGQWVAK